MRATKTVALSLILAGAGIAEPSLAQLRVAQWNITNWDGSSHTRDSAFQTSIYGLVPAGMLIAGAQMAPDILIAEEITQNGAPSALPVPDGFRVAGQANVNAFVAILNGAPGSPGDWAAAPYVANQGDTGNALFYRTSKVQWLSTITLGTLNVDVGQITSGPPWYSPRDNQRWQVRLVGYSGPGAEMYIYGGHFKSGATSDDQHRREPEATRIRNDANALPAGTNFLLGADFNVQSSAQTAYTTLLSAGTVASGRFFDPISKPGSWNNDCSFRNIHTQEPTPAASAGGSPPSGGMDDRHDQILLAAPLRDGQGMSYLPYTPGGNILAAFVSPASGCPAGFTATAWFDANHSYRCWGNDGNHFNLGIVNNPGLVGDTNTMVGTTIAAALVTTCAGNGHLPVYLDLQVPAALGAPSGTIDLGSVAQNSAAAYTLQIANAADVPRYSKDGSGWGIDGLTYSFAWTSGSGFSAPGGLGPFERAATPAPAQVNSHTILLDTTTTGPKTATLTITTDDADNLTRTITFTANVQNPQGACCNGTGCSVTPASGCSGAYQGDSTACGPAGNPTTCCPANFNGTGGVSVQDIFDFIGAWFARDPRADFNHSGLIGVQDVFDYLAAWLAGC